MLLFFSFEFIYKSFTAEVTFNHTSYSDISIFGSTNLFVSWYFLYNKFGIYKTAAIGLGTPIVAGMISASIESIRNG